MKRVILLLLCIFVCSSVFAVANVGEYDIDDVSDIFAKSFISLG